MPIQHKYCFIAVHHTLTEFLNNENFFGGISIVLKGDFAQILLVHYKGAQATIVQTNIQCSFIWS